MSSSQPLYVLGLIPARGGSKGVPRKNVRSLRGRPLIHYTCDAALQSHRLSRTIVSTDSEEIAKAAQAAGISAPFIRPCQFAADEAPMSGVIEHALGWLNEHEQAVPDVVVLLQPTAPLRQSRHIDEAIDLLDSTGADSVVSVTPVPLHFHPQWQLSVVGGRLRPLLNGSFAGLPTRRQDLTCSCVRNGAVYAFRRHTFEKYQSIYGHECVPYVMPPELSVNIDSEMDWHRAEQLLASQEPFHAAA